MKNCTATIVLLSILLVPPRAFTQTHSLRFERIGIEQGLPQSSVFTIAQDTLGFMWFGTQDGLHKYDGYRFATYRTIPGDSTSLSYNRITTILVDSKGRLWVGGLLKGLSRFDPLTETFQRFKIDSTEESAIIENETINEIYEDSHGRIWIGTNGTLYLRDPETNSASRFPGILNQQAIIEDSRGNIWIGMYRNGLYKIDGQTGRIRHFPDSFVGRYVHAILEDSYGAIWLGTEFEGVYKILPERYNDADPRLVSYKPDEHDNYSISNRRITNIFEDSRRQLWIATRDGLNLYDRKNDRFIRYKYSPSDPHSLSDNDVRALYEDNQGLLWIGTFGGGINRLDLYGKPFVTYTENESDPNSLKGKTVFAILEDHAGQLWVGTREGGLNKYDRKSGTFRHYLHNPNDPNSLPDNYVRGIFEYNENVLGICTEYGFSFFDKRNGRCVNYPAPQSFSAFRTSRNELLVSNWYHPVRVFDKITGIVTPFMDIEKIGGGGTDFFEDQDRQLWITTFDVGLVKVDLKTDSVRIYKAEEGNPNSLTSDKAFDLAVDNEGDMWIATTQGGLNKFDPVSESFTHYRKKDGMSSDLVFGVLVDDRGYVWSSTSSGINKLDPRTGMIRHYSEQDGLPSNDFNFGGSHKSRSGRLYFGSTNGLVEFYPDSIRDNTRVPSVVITDLLLFNKSVSVTDTTVLHTNINYADEITLDYSDYIFSFEFSALNFRQPDENSYAYKLVGFNDTWIETSSRDRKATYTNVPYGEYVFRVKASNNDGYWNEEGASLRVIILPPWWLTIWAKMLWAVLILGSVVTIYLVRISSLKKQQRKLEQQVEDRTKEVVKQKDEIELQKVTLEQKNVEIQVNLEALKKTQMQLVLQEKMASLGQMTAGIAHEIKNPLNFVTNFSEVTTELTQELQEALGRLKSKLPATEYESLLGVLRDITQNVADISENSRRADGIVQSMMLHTRGEKGERRPVDINYLLDQNVNLAYHGFRARDASFNVTLEKDFDETIGELNVVHQDLGRVFLNILNNACYAVREKAKGLHDQYSPTIWARTRNLDEWVQIIIRDNGPGIPEEIRDKIFEPFFTTKPTGEGNTGLGLSISYDIVVNEHHGRLEVESQAGEFTEFVIRLPKKNIAKTGS